MITYGFYDSVNHDRRYNALQFGSIFDGIVRDGIFMSIGTCFRVTPSDGMMVLVGVGRAWFNHTWTLNDAPLPLTIPQSEVLLDRIDAIVLDINADREVRANDVIIIRGTPSKNPERPSLINSFSRHQYPLAYIYVKANTTGIRNADITSMIGTSQTPYVTGILETVNIDALLDQWTDLWNVWYETETGQDEQEWDTWFTNYKTMMDEWTAKNQNDFIQWFNNLQYILEGDVGAKLTLEVSDLQNRVLSLEKFKYDLLYYQSIYDDLYDGSGENIVDSDGNRIGTQIVFEVKGNRR